MCTAAEADQGAPQRGSQRETSQRRGLRGHHGQGPEGNRRGAGRARDRRVPGRRVRRHARAGHAAAGSLSAGGLSGSGRHGRGVPRGRSGVGAGGGAQVPAGGVCGGQRPSVDASRGGRVGAPGFASQRVPGLRPGPRGDGPRPARVPVHGVRGRVGPVVAAGEDRALSEGEGGRCAPDLLRARGGARRGIRTSRPQAFERDAGRTRASADRGLWPRVPARGGGGAARGHAPYMAPEVVQGSRASRHSDIYAQG
jgi:hypothetical protein